MLASNRFYLLILAFFLWPYLGAPLYTGYLPVSWRFALAFLVLIALAKRQWPQNWLHKLGLRISLRQIIYCLVALIISLLGFYFIVRTQLQAGGFFQPFSSSGKYLGNENIYVFSWIVNRIFQPLNEEIVLRALLLGLLANLCSHKMTLSISTALIFAALHQAMYALSPFGLLTPLNMEALITLFCFSWAANALYFATGHIGFGVVLHVAWNVWRFFGPIYQNGLELNEAQTFNILEGSIPVMVLVSLMCGLCVLALWRYDKKNLLIGSRQSHIRSQIAEDVSVR
jgi:membrane protease YdiL (CAAX protease family)